MSKWMIQGTDTAEEGTADGFKRINAAKNRNELFRDKAIVFVDDQEKVHADINNLAIARKASLLPKEKHAGNGKGAPG